MAKINNLFKFSNKKLKKIIKKDRKIKKRNIHKIQLKNRNENFHLIIEKFFNKKQINFILDEINKHKWKQIDINGYTKTNNPKLSKKYKGSLRNSIINKKFTKFIWKKIKSIIPKIRKYNKDMTIDNENIEIWKPIGINTLIRFMKYKKGSILIPHYDAPYNKNDNIKTLTTIVIYLTDNKTGETRFIKDKTNITKEKKFKDKKNIINKSLLNIKPEKGKLIMFDHRILHDSNLLLDNNDKIIMRLDILYKKVI